jgi:tetratricopeptide (TPR) repeat protein
LAEYTLSTFQRDPAHVQVRFAAGSDAPSVKELTAEAVSAFAADVEAKLQLIGNRGGWLQPQLDLGRLLYRWLHEVTDGRIDEAVTSPGTLTLRLDLLPELQALPWELLARDTFLADHATRPFSPVRVCNATHEWPQQANRPLRVLFMACSPVNLPDDRVLRFEEEESLILDAARGRSIELEVEESGSLAGLGQRLADFGDGHFDVVHLTGHANIQDGNPYFAAEDDFGQAKPAFADDLGEAFGTIWPRVVVVSGCKTGQAGPGGAFPSLSEKLVESGAAAVVGWSASVADPTGNVCAQHLYGELCAARPLCESVAEARRELLKANRSDWHLLRLYTGQGPLGPLVTPAKTKGRAHVPLRPARTQMLSQGCKTEVATRETFVGRRRPLQHCLRALASVPGTPDHVHGVLVHGMGGLGKSSLAARLMDRLHNHRRVVIPGAFDETEFIRRAADQLPAEAGKLLNEPDLSLRHRLRAVFEGPLATDPAIFLFDDFEHSIDLSLDGDLPSPSASSSCRGAIHRARSCRGAIHGAPAPDPADYSPPAEDLDPDARSVLAALFHALEDTGSESRAIVTSRCQFPVPAPGRLLERGLSSMRGAELAKKCDLLKAWQKGNPVADELRDAALSAADGNPRLLEALDKVLMQYAAADAQAILAAMEAAADEFREEVLAEQLIAREGEAMRRLLALWTLPALPVPEAAFRALAGDGDLGDALTRAVSVGLVETGLDEVTQQPLYHVSDTLGPLVATAATPDEGEAAAARAAEALHQLWWGAGGGPGEDRAREILRLAVQGKHLEVAAQVGRGVSSALHEQSRFREAAAVAALGLTVGEDYRLLRSLARAEEVLGEAFAAFHHYRRALALCPTGDDVPREILQVRAAILGNLAGLHAQRGEVDQALTLYQQSLDIREQIADARGKAATLDSMADIHSQRGDLHRAVTLYQQCVDIHEQIADARGKAATLHETDVIQPQRGEIDQALTLCRQALDIYEQIGDARGKGGTLHQMAGIYAQRGEIAQALTLYRQSLNTREQIGDARGKAATLHQMAGIHAQRGEIDQALTLYRQSLDIKEQIGDARGKAATLAEMGFVAWKQGDVSGARTYYAEAASILVAMRAWPDAVTVAANLSQCDPIRARVCLAQALWLALRVEAGLQDTALTAAALHQDLGDDHPVAPRLATTAMYFVMTRGEKHVEREELEGLAGGMFRACAQARGIAEDDFPEWVARERFNDPSYFLPALSRALEEMVGEDEWLFDRSQVPRPEWDV